MLAWLSKYIFQFNDHWIKLFLFLLLIGAYIPNKMKNSIIKYMDSRFRVLNIEKSFPCY